MRSLQSSGDRTLQLMSIEDSLPSISDLINSPLSKYITLAANDCGMMALQSYDHPLFLHLIWPITHVYPRGKQLIFLLGRKNLLRL